MSAETSNVTHSDVLVFFTFVLPSCQTQGITWTLWDVVLAKIVTESFWHFEKEKKTSLCECVTANTRICAVKQQINSNNRTNQSKNKNGMCYRDPGAISKVIGKILNHVLSNSYWCLSQDDLITYFAWTTVLKPKILSLPTEREMNKEKCDSSETRRYSGISL